jgi:acetoin:2,6-dichlorophenolindophenol oxidoreductase subunit alpha
MNLASIWKLPVIFACENNQYAEATPSWYAVSTPDIASRAEGYGMPGVQVDGMDFFAVYDAAGQAVERARSGKGPTLLELKTYRYHGHFHADVPEKYRTKEEEQYYRDQDCIQQFEKRVLEQELMTPKQLEGIRAQPLPVAPRQLPFHVDTTYFELERNGAYWRRLQTSGGLAIHVADEFPDMEIECWAIRD